VLYAVSDEVHQSFVAGRAGRPLDVAIDAVGVGLGIVAWRRVVASRTQRAAGASGEAVEAAP
jgi:VanZ family protein